MEDERREFSPAEEYGRSGIVVKADVREKKEQQEKFYEKATGGRSSREKEGQEEDKRQRNEH